MPRKHPEPLDARAQWLELEQRAQILFDGVQPGDGLVDGAQVGGVGLFERGQRPRLIAEPCGVALRQALFVPVKRRPWRKRNLESRCLAPSRSARMSSRQRRRSRAASSCSVGT